MGIHAGKVWTFGNDGDGGGDTAFSSAGEARHITTATQVTAGGYAFYALLASGQLMAWGDNDDGELGTGSSSQRSGVPAAVKGLTHVTAMAGGMNAGYAIAGGTIYAWGDNYHGDLGDGTTTERRSPVVVPGVFGPTLVAAGDDSAFAVGSYF